MPIIDAHIHLNGNHPDSLVLLEELDLKLLNVCVAHLGQDWRGAEARPYKALAREHPSRYAWCASFDPPAFDRTDYAAWVIEGLEQDFANGAVACKVWKNLGMEIRDPKGRHVMVDNPLFAPIFEHLAGLGKPLLMHIGEPLACWQPLEPSNPHSNYYRSNPQWHMHGRTDIPSHAELIAARDRVLENHPRLRVIGAHLGSLEYDVREVARRFERFPNFAVDTSARLPDLAFQDAAAVRALFQKFPGRILFGTDIVSRTPHDQMADGERSSLLGEIRQNYQRQRAFFSGRAPVEILGRQIPGLGLSADILNQFFSANAKAWYPGL